MCKESDTFTELNSARFRLYQKWGSKGSHPFELANFTSSSRRFCVASQNLSISVIKKKKNKAKKCRMYSRIRGGFGLAVSLIFWYGSERV